MSMKQFKQILYYDLVSERNEFFVKNLSQYCESLQTFFVDDDYASPELKDFKSCDALVTGVFDNYSSLLAKNSNLEYALMLATDTSDFNQLRDQRTSVTIDNSAGYSTNSVAELSLSMMITLYRRVRFLAPEAPTIETKRSFDIAGKCVGIFGAGRIGTSFAEKAIALGMSCIYTGKPNKTLESTGAMNVPIDQLFNQSNVLSINLPFNENTKGIVNKQLIESMKPGSTILCPSRHELFDIEALLSCCEEKSLRVWLDSVDSTFEFNIKDSIKDQIILSSSLGAKSVDSGERLKELAIQTIEKYLRCRTLKNTQAA